MVNEPTVTVVPDAIVDAIILAAVPKEERAQYTAPRHGGGNGYAADRREGKPHQLEGQFTYLDAGGRPHTLTKKWRWPEGKSFSQHHQENGHWVKGKPSGAKIPYRLPQLIAAAPDTPIWVTEGEQDADNLAALGFVATTNSEGALNWTADLNPWFAGKKTVYILEDNDDTGRARTTLVATMLHGIVPDIRVISFPDVKEKGDVSDWLAAGGTKEKLLERAKAAKKAEPVELESVRAADIEVEAYDWLWPDRFALGKIGLVVGLPDVGKGQFFCYMVARVTTGGAWPCGEGVVKDVGNVVILTAEDSPSDTVVPRLMAAGADLARVYFIKMVREGGGKKRGFSLLADLPRLARFIDQIGDVKMVLIDPITAYLGVGKIDSFRGADVRGALTPLSDLAEEKHLAIVAIMHFNKKIDVTNALLRVSDSVAFGALARHVYAIIEDAEHGRQLFVKAKNNLAKKAGARSLAFTFHDRDVGADPKSGKRIVSPFIVFDAEPVDITATEAMEAANTAGANISVREEAEDFLRERLAAGPVKTADIEEEARANLISKRTLERAKQRLGIVARKEKGTMGGAWLWELPPDA
jgi:putative DNA primase/helicase